MIASMNPRTRLRMPSSIGSLQLAPSNGKTVVSVIVSVMA